MRATWGRLFPVLALVAGAASLLAAGGPPALAAPPLLFRHPALGPTDIAFEFGGDLWAVPRAGGDARRLTTDPGREMAPVFSPDGGRIAFTGEYDGNVDVFVMPAEGGVPERLTWHPSADEVIGWAPDGRRVLFRSDRDSPATYPRLFTIGFDEGLPTPLALPAAFEGCFSPDGSHLAYVPHPKWQRGWKRYRGGQTWPIWIVRLADAALEKVPREDSNDSNPMWIGDTIYFLSDRDGNRTLFAYDTAARTVRQVLPCGGFDIRSASAGPGAIVWERLGELHLYDLQGGTDRRVDVRIAADLREVRPRWVKVSDGIQTAGISPTAKRALFEARGDIFTVPAEKGEIRNLTRTPGVADRDPAWSPDGKQIAYFSDASSEYALHIRSQDGLGEPRVLPLGDPPSFFYAPRWSPDGKKILYTDKRLQLWYVALDEGAPVRVDSDHYETPERSLDPRWSPDSGWIVYTKSLPSYLHAVFAYELATRKIVQLTDGMSDARWPVFDPDGKHLYFAASTDIGLAASWLDLSSVDRPVTRSVYVAVLGRDQPSPLAPESDEEGEEEDKKTKSREKEKSETKDASEPPRTTIDVEGLSQRILAVPVPARRYVGLQVGKEAQIFLAEGPAVPPLLDEPATLTVYRFDFEKRKEEKLLEGVKRFVVAERGEKMLFERGDGWFLAGTGEPPKPGDEALVLDGMEALVDPRAEWRQMYREVWRIQRDFLYDPNHHGLDLGKAAARFAPYLDGLAGRDDLNDLFEEMLAELSLGHVFVGGGDRPQPPKVAGGLLGADFTVESGRYRFARVYDGESWNPVVRAPLTAPGVDVRAGEYLLAVNGRELRPPASPFAPFVETAGKAVPIRVSSDPSGKKARDVTVVPVSTQGDVLLRIFAWVEDNRRTVDRLSSGRLAYVYLPNTGGLGYRYFNRYFFSQVGKEGVVLDDRFNGGGYLADYVIDHLRRPVMSLLTTREGAEQHSPGGAIFGPKVMLVNEMAGSGGDAMPWYFRNAALGKLVGKRTWGGLVGIYDYPALIDGGQVTAPRVALYGLDGDWEVENAGIAPDVEVELDPKLWREGRDAQLEKAVEIALDELRRQPPAVHPRPPYPDYHRGGPLGK